MSWRTIGDSGTRWTWEAGDVRHLLFFDAPSGELREYHEVPDGPVTVHVYAGNVGPTDDAAPLDYADHIESMDVALEHAPWVRALDDREVFDWLASAGYAKS